MEEPGNGPECIPVAGKRLIFPAVSGNHFVRVDVGPDGRIFIPYSDFPNGAAFGSVSDVNDFLSLATINFEHARMFFREEFSV